jgi:hypothetical protein
VATLAVGRELCCRVAWISRGVVRRLVTRIAVGRRAGVAARMASEALQRDMRAGQREVGSRVVESCRFPGGRRMARRADMAEIVLHVIGVSHGGEVSCVAVITRRRRIDIPLGVAGDTLQRRVCSRQRERGCAVIEGGRIPG